MSFLTDTDQDQHPPRMVGRVRAVELPLLRGTPDPEEYHEHLAPDGRRVFVARQVLRELAELERREHPVETAGLLFGGFFSDGRHPCTVVAKLLAPCPGDVVGTRSTVTITPSGAERMLRRATREDPVLVPIGWAHTHPSFEAYFSEVDRAEQRSWRSPGSVGMVLSGLRHARPHYRVFVGPDSATAEGQPPLELPVISQDVEVKMHRHHLATTPHEPLARDQNQAARRLRRDWTVLRRDDRRGSRQSSPRRGDAGSKHRHHDLGTRAMRKIRADARRPVMVTQILLYAVVGALLVSLAISLYAMSVAREARLQALGSAAALNDRVGTGTVEGEGDTSSGIAPVFSEARLRWNK